MYVNDYHFSEAAQVFWNGQYLANRLGVMMKCVKNIGTFKLYVNRTQSGSGDGNDKEYFVVNTQTNKVYRYNGMVVVGISEDIGVYLERKMNGESM